MTPEENAAVSGAWLTAAYLERDQARRESAELRVRAEKAEAALLRVWAERDALRDGIQALADREGRIHKPGPVFMDNGGRACVSCHNWWPCQPLKGLRGLLSPTPEPEGTKP